MKATRERGLFCFNGNEGDAHGVFA